MSLDKYTRSILDKFEIKDLNPMQKKAGQVIRKNEDVVILSPTGTGKTLAFLLPLIEKLDLSNLEELQNYLKKKWSKKIKCGTKLIIPIEAYLNDM